MYIGYITIQIGLFFWKIVHWKSVQKTLQGFGTTTSVGVWCNWPMQCWTYSMSLGEWGDAERRMVCHEQLKQPSDGWRSLSLKWKIIRYRKGITFTVLLLGVHHKMIADLLSFGWSYPHHWLCMVLLAMWKYDWMNSDKIRTAILYPHIVNSDEALDVQVDFDPYIKR